MMNEQPAKPPLRFVAEFSEECHVTTLLRRVWILLPNHLGTVSELAAYLGENFIQLDPESPVNIVLEIGGVPVAPYEDIAIIRDSDTIRVRVYQPEAEFPALEGAEAKLAIEGPKEVKAGSVDRKKKKREEDSIVKGDKNNKKRKKREGEAQEGLELVVAKVSAVERTQVDSKTPKEEEGKSKKRSKKGRIVELSEELGKGGVSVETGAPSIEKKGKRAKQNSGKEPVLEEEEGGQLERVGRTEGDKKRKKRSRGEVAGIAEEGVGAGAQELVPPLEKARKRKRLKGNEDEVAQEVRETEAPLQLGWVEEEAAGAAAEKLTGDLQRESSSESESEDEGPKKEKRTPSRSARRKAAKRRYARLAREAAAAGGSEAVVLYPGDVKASSARAAAPPTEEAREHLENRNAVPASNGPLSRQHMHFGDSDEEEGALKTRAERQPPIVLNVGLGPSGQPLSKERGKEWGLQKGRKKDRYKGEPREQTPSWAAVPPPEQTDPKADRKSQKVPEGVERRRTADEYKRLPDLNRAPQIADVLAYRLVELTSSWTPQISDYREGRVMSFDAASGTVSLAWWPAEDLAARKEASAQLDGEVSEGAPPAFAPPYDEDGNLESDLSSLMGVKLVQASAVTLAQLPGAPPVPATGLTVSAGKESPSSVLATDGAQIDGLQAETGGPGDERERSNPEGFKEREKEGDSVRPDGLSRVNGTMKEGAWSHDRVEEGGVSNEKGHGHGGLAENGGQQESEKATSVLQEKVFEGQPMGVGAPPADVITAPALDGETFAGGPSGGPTNEVRSAEERAAEEAGDVPGQGTQHANGALEEVMEAAICKNPSEVAGKSGVGFKAGKGTAGRGAVENGRPEAAAGLKGLNAMKGAGPMPPAWQAWESVAQLLARRRAEIAEEARKQEEERKRQREAEEKAAEQREESSEGEGRREGSGEKRDERHVDGTGEEREGAPDDKEEGRDTCAKEQNGQRYGRELGPERIPERITLPGGKDALVNDQVEREAKDNPGQGGSLGLPTESTGETTEEAGVVDRHVRAGVTGGELISSLAVLDPDVARKRDESGVESLEARRNSSEKTGKSKEKQGNGKGGYGVGPRGVIKPRAPRLGALGPTLAYLRSQSDQLR